ncbi:hypothetical protein [Paenibacillus agilis]|uniref:DUF4367 domain-containing protein n=1 Tax=Paenibacillus agilis TaxID=3020863 RepID=A0A559J0H8_9BACL|nr:hypothetical protein [Paenibacillus agilis]TVX93398.1 hypothetical protein FPZ44_10235 [Paenibacillus agilis]
MKAASKAAIAVFSGVLLLGSTAYFTAEVSANDVTQQKPAKKASNASKSTKAIPEKDKEFIEKEMKRVKELAEKSGDMYILYHKYKQLNSGLDISYWGGIHHYKTYEEYLKKASTLKGSILQQPAKLPKGYSLSEAKIEGPTEGKFVADVRAEGKKSEKPLYIKKIDWKEAATIRLKYTSGKETITFSKYMLDADSTKKKGFYEDELPAHIYPKYIYWQDDKFGYSISTTFAMPKKQKIELLKAAIKK